MTIMKRTVNIMPGFLIILFILPTLLLNAKEISSKSILANIISCDSVQTVNNVESPINDIDSIPQYTELEELVIVKKKDVITSDGASTTYNVAEDDASKSSTLLDILKKVPGITVDGQDNIYINGDSNYRIYVNGKEDPMMMANAKQVFKSTPASAFAKIEVITEPGAQYDAEGSAGIINLISEVKQKNDGYSVSLSYSLNNREEAASIFGRLKNKRFGIDANVIYAGSLFDGQENYGKEETINTNSTELYRQIYDFNQLTRFNYISGSLNSSWEPGENDIISFGGSITNIIGNLNKFNGATSIYSIQGDIISKNTMTLSGNLKMLSATGNASYQHNFSGSGNKIIFGYLFNFGNTPFNINSSQWDEDNKELPILSYTYKHTIQREHTFQLDYTNDFNGEKHKLDAGIKIILRHNTALGLKENEYADNQYSSEISDYTNVRQNQNIYAIYSTYKGTYGNISAVGGLRYEHTDMGLSNYPDKKESFTRKLNDIVPNASLTYVFSPASNLRLGYQMRISRPTIEQMNPFQFDITGTSSEEGNPNLKSERSNRLSLTYTNFGRILGGNVYVDYKFTDNAIERYLYYTETDNLTVAHNTSANIGHISNFGLGGFLNISVNQKMSINIDGRISYVTLKSNSPDYSNNGWIGNYSINWNYTCPGDIKLSAYGGQNTRIISLQGFSNGWYYYGLGLSRDFLKSKSLNIALNASNFLSKYMTFIYKSSSDNITTTNTYKNKQWSVGLSLTWNFGHLKSQIRKTDINIQNDDQAPGVKKNGGIGL